MSTWSNRARPSPGEQIKFADLRNIDLTASDLTGVVFLGCLLNGLALRDCRLTGTRLICCFAATEEAPVDFTGSQGVPEVVDSFVGSLTGIDRAGALWRSWPDDVALAAGGAFGNNAERYHAALLLGDSNFVKAAPVLACFTTDREWDVRAAALTALSRLHQIGTLPEEAAVIEFALERLGDDNSLVVSAAIDLLESVQPNQGLYRRLIVGDNDRDEESALRRLRTVVSLARSGGPGDVIQAAFDLDDWKWALTSGSPAVRAQYLYVLGTLDIGDSEQWARGLGDPDPEVRARCLVAIRLLTDPPPIESIEAMMRDVSPGVRVEALFTLGQYGEFDHEIVERALRDPDDDVRRYARALLAQSLYPDE